MELYINMNVMLWGRPADRHDKSIPYIAVLIVSWVPPWRRCIIYDKFINLAARPTPLMSGPSSSPVFYILHLSMDLQSYTSRDDSAICLLKAQKAAGRRQPKISFPTIHWGKVGKHCKFVSKIVSVALFHFFRSWGRGLLKQPYRKRS